MEDFKKRYIRARKRLIARDFARLNPRQLEGVLTTEGALLLLAGAGSGKTTVLINRVANLLTYGRGSDTLEVPDFVTEDDFNWAVGEASAKKKVDFSKVEFLTYDEGLCVQCMHIGSYDDEPATVAVMHEFMESQGYALDITDKRLHHEIYLSDARKVAPEKRKTVIRHPIKRS